MVKTFKTSETEQYNVPIYGNKDINIFYSIREFNMSDLDSFLLDGFTIVLIRSGHATMNVDGKLYDLNAGNIFISTPLNITKNVMTSLDFDVAGLLISSSFGKKLAMESKFNITPLYIDRLYSFKDINENDQQLFIKYLEIFALILNDSNKPNEKHLFSVFQAFGLFMQEIAKNECPNSEEQQIGNNSAETIVRRFVTMLSNQHSDFLSINEYADKLHITPKYLAAICKSVTGKTPNQIKNEQIIMEIKIRLANTNLSIKEISNILGFATPSHFGVFLKRNTGKTAQELRDEM